MHEFTEKDLPNQFSRKILVWDLFPSMEALNIELLIMRAKELYPDAHARLIHDNGKQFYARNFLDLVSKLELEETATSPFHPQSNGKVERCTGLSRRMRFDATPTRTVAMRNRRWKRGFASTTRSVFTRLSSI